MLSSCLRLLDGDSPLVFPFIRTASCSRPITGCCPTWSPLLLSSRTREHDSTKFKRTGDRSRAFLSSSSPHPLIPLLLLPRTRALPSPCPSSAGKTSPSRPSRLLRSDRSSTCPIPVILPPGAPLPPLISTATIVATTITTNTNTNTKITTPSPLRSSFRPKPSLRLRLTLTPTLTRTRSRNFTLPTPVYLHLVILPARQACSARTPSVSVHRQTLRLSQTRTPLSR